MEMIDLNESPSEETLSSNGSKPSKEMEHEDGSLSQNREIEIPRVMKTHQQMVRFGDLHTSCDQIAEIGAENEESFKLAMKLLDETKETLLKHKSENRGMIQHPSSSSVKDGDKLKYSSGRRHKSRPLMKKQKGREACATCERTLLKKGWRLESSSQMVHPSGRSNSYVRSPLGYVHPAESDGPVTGS